LTLFIDLNKKSILIEEEINRMGRVNMKKFICFSLIFVFILLYATNPNNNEFKSFFMMNEIKPDTWNKDSVDYFNKITDLFSRRQNYIIFSIYDFKQNSNSGYVHKKYVAVFNQFIRFKSEVSSKD